MKPIAISFDALGTLIEVKGGVGFQYHRLYKRFLLNNGVFMEVALSSATPELIDELAAAVIREEVAKDRAVWHVSYPNHSPKEMPIGGMTDDTLCDFWQRVLDRVYRHPRLLEGATEGVIGRLDELWSNEELWYRWKADLIIAEFGSSRTYQWLYEGRQTLLRLEEWRLRQEKMRTTLPDVHGTTSTLYMNTPPCVVSNMDPRLRRIFQDLGALEGSGSPRLLHEVWTARDLGYAKPSAVGLRRCAEAGGVTDMRYLIHVGDADVDAEACEMIGCRYLRCDMRTGVVWKQLADAIKELEALE